MQRQGLLTSPAQLRKIAEELEEEYLSMREVTGFRIPMNKNCVVAIINKTKESDTWRFERR